MFETGDILPMPETNPAVSEFLQHRRSNLAKVMSGPGPTEAQIESLLQIAARVPDHRKLTPWRFIVFAGEARAEIGQYIGAAFSKNNPDMPVDRVIFESQRFTRAPLVVGIVSSPVVCPRGTPEWEQVLSSGIVCYNLLIAAQAAGFGAQWLTEWYAYDSDVQQAMGLSDDEKIAGFIYIGTPEQAPVERARPKLDDLVTRWTQA